MKSSVLGALVNLENEMSLQHAIKPLSPYLTQEQRVQVIVRRWRMRTLAICAKKYHMVCKWDGHKVVGFDRETKSWVTLYDPFY